MEVNEIVVYTDKDKLYLSKEICEKYNIGYNNCERIIKNNLCIKITDIELKKVVEENHLEIIYIPIMNFDMKINIEIYKKDNNLYIKKEICNNNDINSEDEIIINNEKYCNVTENDIINIERKTLGKGIIPKKIYKLVPINKKLFIYYNDLNSKKYYIQRDILEDIRRLNIEIEGKPEIINNKNCYSILLDQLEEYQKISNSCGIEHIIDNSIKVKRDKKILETRIIYKDKSNNKIYIPEEYAINKNTNKKIIMNKPCYEATLYEIECMYNLKIYIVDVYTKPIEETEILEDSIKEKVRIIVCNNKGRLYISENIIKKLELTPINNTKIKVNTTIYNEINEDILNEIKNNQNIEALIEIKDIVPIKK